MWRHKGFSQKMTGRTRLFSLPRNILFTQQPVLGVNSLFFQRKPKLDATIKRNIHRSFAAGKLGKMGKHPRMGPVDGSARNVKWVLSRQG